MKKATILLLMFFSVYIYAQQKTTGTVVLSTNVSAGMTLNNETSTVLLTLTGPSDRWFALQYGSFSVGEGMKPGADFVYWNGSTIVDGIHNGLGITPTIDPLNNWTVLSNVTDSPTTGLRTITCSRPFSTGDVNDYTFNYNDETIDFAWSRRSLPGYTLEYHGATNRGYGIGNQFSDILSNKVFSLSDTSIFPNPTFGNFSVKTVTRLTKINVYSQTGQLVRAIDVKDNSENVEVNVKGLETGVYFLELQNDSEKLWKKVIVN